MGTFKYISKAPCGKDLFAGKVHERTAEQIASQLLSTDKSLMIGIDGGWGTGKSNLIRMIELEVSKSKGEGKKNALFFTYDAWGHQNDMPRRSILEELTSKITESNILGDEDAKKWREKLKILMSQRREVSTKSIPKVSTGILVLSLVFILTPVFSTVSEIIPDDCSPWWKLGITVLPFLSGLFYAGKKFFSLKQKNLRSFLNEFISLYQERTKEETSYEMVFSEEPTSTQFRQWMQELDSHLRAPLILVFDNMDRLPSAKVQEFWAAIHAFFAEESYENIQVIVPFDRSHIISAFKGEDCNAAQNYGNDFIDKTFDVVYRVAPPTLSNWKNYLSNLWEEAFSERLSPNNSVTQAYDLLTSSKTPREIVTFVNDCVTIRNTSDPNIPIEYVALFVIGKQSIDANPQEELLKLTFLNSLAYKYHNEDTSKNLSALYYQLSPNEALDIIYADQLRRELDSGHSGLLQDLVSQSFFSEILEHAIAQVSHVENATQAFAKVEDGSPIATHFWEQLAMKAPDENKSPKEYQIILLNHTTEKISKPYLERIIKAIYDECQFIENKYGLMSDTFNARKFYESISQLEKGLETNNILSPLSYLHQKSTSPELFVEFVNISKDAYLTYLIDCPAENLDSYIAEMSTEDLGNMQAVKYMPEDVKGKLLKYKASLKEAIGKSNNPDEAETLMSRWIELDCYEKDLMSGNVIASFFSKAKEKTLLYYSLICMQLARGGSSSSTGMNNILQKEDDTLIKELSKYIHLFIRYDDLLLMYQSMKGYPLYRSLVRHLVSERKERVLSVEKLLPLYKEISSSLDIQIVDLLTDWDRCSEYLEGSITAKTILSMPIEFFADTQEQQHLRIVSHCREVGKKYLQSISLDDWEEHFGQGSREYKLLMSLGCDCPNALEAFKQTIKADLEEQRLRLPDEIYQSLVSLFEVKKKKWESVFQNVRDRYGEMGADITIDLFKRYGKSLIRCGKLSENHNAIRTLLPTSLIMNSDTLSILITECNEVAQILNSAEKEYKQEFCDMVLSVYESKAETKDEMEELIAALKIKFPSGDSKEFSLP